MIPIFQKLVLFDENYHTVDEIKYSIMGIG